MALVLLGAVVDDVDLAADDRLHPLRLRGFVEVDRAGQRAVVGERDGGHLEPRRLLRERRDPARPVEDRVLGVDVQVDEVGAHERPSYSADSDVPERLISPLSTPRTRLQKVQAEHTGTAPGRPRITRP